MILKRFLALSLTLAFILSCFSQTTFAADSYLDLEEGETYLDTKSDISQIYMASVDEPTSDKTKVQVSWALEDISVTVTNNQIWDPNTLSWVEDTSKSNGAVVEDVEASFSFINYSSIKIEAQVEFAVSSGFTPITPAFTDNGVAGGDGIIILDTKADANVTTEHTGNITAILSPVDSDFDEKTSGGTYGTYTVRIDYIGNSITTQLSNIEEVAGNVSRIKNGKTASLKFKVSDYSSYRLPGQDNITVTGASVDSWSIDQDSYIGTLVLSNPTGAVTVSMSALNDVVLLTGISLDTESVTLANIGDSYKLTVTAYTPEDATYKAVSWSSSDESAVTVDESGNVTRVGSGDATITATAIDGSGVSASCSVGGGGCFAAGTKITMADGTQKNIENIEIGEKVLTFNHETGKCEAQKVYFVYAYEAPAHGFTMHFTNDIDITIVADHDFFVKEDLQYVKIFQGTARSYIGKHFYNAVDKRYEELLSVTEVSDPVYHYMIYTEYNANCFANRLLTVSPDTECSVNIYKFNEDLSIDHTQLAKDIAKFGLYEYPANASYSKELFDALGWKYIYIMVGKGFGTWDDFVARQEAFLAG